MNLPPTGPLSSRQFNQACFKSCLAELVKLLNLQTLSKVYKKSSIVPNAVGNDLILFAMSSNLDSR
jgi:hypothetical protein